MSNGSWETELKPTTQTTERAVTPVGKVRQIHTDTINVNLRGRVGTSIELMQYASGHVSAKFRLAVPKKGRDELNQWHDLGATWYSVRMWGKLADNAQRSLRKGDPVYVSGRLEVNEWQKENGQHGVELLIVANAVGHDLNQGISAFGRMQTPEQAAEQTLAENQGTTQTATETTESVSLQVPVSAEVAAMEAKENPSIEEVFNVGENESALI
ncbi:single-stranded DNA-binding protein [Gleimia coleocanis]|nr:single-stranded DNA-binding protein [Gleimia coleocanis]